jgi:hypothetical protein
VIGLQNRAVAVGVILMLEPAFFVLVRARHNDTDYFTRGHYLFWKWFVGNITAIKECIGAINGCIGAINECLRAYIRGLIRFLYGMELLLDPMEEASEPPPYTVSPLLVAIISSHYILTITT